MLSFVVMFIFTGICSGVLENLGLTERTRVLTLSVIQGILAFTMPTLLTWMLTSRDPASEIGLRQHVSSRYWIWIIALYLLAYPGMCQTVFWNEHMDFPASMSGLEQTLRKWETAGADTTDAILLVQSVWRLIVNILIVGLFTGCVEEMFFRAGLQKLIVRSGIRPVAAVWIAAFIFSAVHMQFFGFLPRLLLGAMFGYVYYRTGSLPASALLHGLNNSVVVFTTWLSAHGIINNDIDSFFINESGFPWIFLISLAATAAFLYLTGRNSRMFKEKA